MMNGMNPLRFPVITTGNPERNAAKPSAIESGSSFKDMLAQRISAGQSGTLTFSKHAQARTEQRGISLSQRDIARLDDAVLKAGDKGITDTLVFMDNTAYIVNVPNRIVVTVIEGKETDNTVFTNIDGAVIV